MFLANSNETCTFTGIGLSSADRIRWVHSFANWTTDGSSPVEINGQWRSTARFPHVTDRCATNGTGSCAAGTECCASTIDGGTFWLQYKFARDAKWTTYRSIARKARNPNKLYRLADVTSKQSPERKPMSPLGGTVLSLFGNFRGIQSAWDDGGGPRLPT